MRRSTSHRPIYCSGADCTVPLSPGTSPVSLMDLVVLENLETIRLVLTLEVVTFTPTDVSLERKFYLSRCQSRFKTTELNDFNTK